jgi:hypothetical protein
MCQRVNIVHSKIISRIIQLGRLELKVTGELKDVMIRLSLDPWVCQIIDIVVFDIAKAYSLLLSRDWSHKL